MPENPQGRNRNAGWKPTPVRLTEELDAQITRVAERLQRSKQEVIRLALELGLEHIRQNNFNLAAPVVSASTLQSALEAVQELLKQQK